MNLIQTYEHVMDIVFLTSFQVPVSLSVIQLLPAQPHLRSLYVSLYSMGTRGMDSRPAEI